MNKNSALPCFHALPCLLLHPRPGRVLQRPRQEGPRRRLHAARRHRARRRGGDGRGRPRQAQSARAYVEQALYEVHLKKRVFNTGMG
jgi:hypothetical protein